MKQKNKRLIKFLFFFTLLGISITLILNSFQSNLIYFYSPTEINELTNKEKINNKKIRVGGLIKKINKKNIKNKKINNYFFIITDNKNEIKINYEGILPPMFRESQGIVAEGEFNKKNIFVAEKLITKHDENYMPPEVKKSIIEAGHPEK